MPADRPETAIWLSDEWRVAHASGSSLLGWLVVIPRRHVEGVHELSASESATLGPLLQKVSLALVEELGCSKTYVVMFAEAPGFTHVHFHVVPRAEDLPPELRGARVFDFLKRPETEWVALALQRDLALRLRARIGELDDPTVREHSLTDGVVNLNPLVENDATEWLAGEDEEQRRWFEAPRPARLIDIQRFVSECQESWRTMGSHRHWGIRNVGSDPLVGGVDLRELGNDEVNLSYLVFPAFRRRGFAFRASQLALEYARTTMGAKNAVIKVLSGNEPSRNLAIALGALYVGDEPSESGATFRVYRLSLQRV